MYGLALCSGAGGLELGVSLAAPGYRAVCYVEGETYAAGVLAARMEEACLAPAPIWDDLRTFDGRPWRGIVDIVTAGYPCQPFSLAGKQRGERDPRYLWPDVKRVIGEVKPALVFCENVSAHLSNGFDIVARDMEALGYRVAAGVFTAWAVGAPHQRERLFWLAHTDGDVLREQQRRGCGTCWSGAPISGVHSAERSLADTKREGLERPTWNGVHNSRWSTIKSTSGCADDTGWWSSEPGVGRMVDGLAHRVDRLRAIGNGVVPAVAARAFRVLMEELCD